VGVVKQLTLVFFHLERPSAVMDVLKNTKISCRARDSLLFTDTKHYTHKSQKHSIIRIQTPSKNKNTQIHLILFATAPLELIQTVPKIFQLRTVVMKLPLNPTHEVDIVDSR